MLTKFFILQVLRIQSRTGWYSGRMLGNAVSNVETFDKKKGYNSNSEIRQIACFEAQRLNRVEICLLGSLVWEFRLFWSYVFILIILISFL